jgi:putative nucleotidyltransferase with HDIG domain
VTENQQPATVDNLRSALEAIACGLCVFEPDGSLRYVNRWLRARLGIADDVPAGEIDLARLGDEDWRGFLRRRCVPSAGPPRTFTLQAHDGTRLDLQAASACFAPFARGGEFFMLTLAGVTARVTAERQLQELNHHLSTLTDTTIEQAVELKRNNTSLEQKVEARTAEITAANLAALRMLAVASEARDADTGQHVLRIQKYTERLATQLGLPHKEVRMLGLSAILHDVGKIHTPDRILLKPGPLTEEERREMQNHTVIGERILAESPYFSSARQIARQHHENWDGSGYPDGRRGDQTSLCARIVHVADVYDALSQPRVSV